MSELLRLRNTLQALVDLVEDLGKGGSGTGRVNGSVVDAIGRQIRQRASVGVRRRGRPGGVQDCGSRLGGHQEDSAEDQAETRKPLPPGTHQRLHIHSEQPKCHVETRLTSIAYLRSVMATQAPGGVLDRMAQKASASPSRNL